MAKVTKVEKMVWIAPVGAPVPWPHTRPLQFLTEPTAIPERVLSQLYWQERLRPPAEIKVLGGPPKKVKKPMKPTKKPKKEG